MKPNQIKNYSLAATGVAALALLTSCARAQQPQQPQTSAVPFAASADRPNVVFILADDLGWMDTSLYGSKFYRTPNIDKLRTHGMMFTRAYTANPLCSPTRASILTGQYPGRLHLTTAAGHLPQEILTAEMPKSAGPTVKVVTAPSLTRLPLTYNTLGNSFKAAGYTTGFMGKWHLGREPYVPENFGFDTVVGGGPFPGPPSFFSPYHMGHYLSDGPKGEHIDDRLGKEAVKFMEANKDKPFYLNVWQYDVHAPFQAKPEYISKYRPLVDKNNPQQSPTYAGMVESLDDLVGTVTDTLDRLKLTDKTMIVFYSDNGGNMYDRVDGTTPTSNLPARNGKGSIWDGGTRVPMIVAWPGHVRPNSTSNALVSSIDFYPTLLDIGHAKNKPGQIEDGVDIRPVLEGTGTLQRDTIFCHFPQPTPRTGTPASVYVHQRDWKLIRIFAGNADGSDQFELYDLSKDIGETHNLAAQMPDKVQQLNALITQHLKDTGAMVPFANPDYTGPAIDTGSPVPLAPPKTNWSGKKRGAGKNKGPRKNEGAAKNIEGWHAGGTAELSRTEGGIALTSAGTDPFFVASDLPNSSGPYSVKFRLNTNIEGEGSVYWTTAKGIGFALPRSASFSITQDGQWHEYSVNLPVTESIDNLRIDPGNAKGVATFEWIRLFDSRNKLVKGWEFNSKP